MGLNLLEVVLLVLCAFSVLFVLGVTAGWALAKKHFASGLSGLALFAALLGLEVSPPTYASSAAHENGE